MPAAAQELEKVGRKSGHLTRILQGGGAPVRATWDSVRKAKVAFSLNELVQLSSDFSKKHAPNCTPQVVRTDPAKLLFVYRVTCKESYSDAKGHLVKLKFDISKLKETGRLADLDVRVSCGCPAFLWWGAQWNLGDGDALYGKPRPRFIPPTDPQRYQNVICKHVKVAADHISPSLERLLAKYQDKRDRAEQNERLKQIDLVKQRVQYDVDQADEVFEQPTPQAPDAYPEDIEGDFTPLAPRPKKNPPIIPKNLIPQETRGLLNLPPVTPSQPPEQEPDTTPPPDQVEPEGAGVSLEPPEPETRGRKAPRVDRPSNITVFDEGEGEPTVLPGKKREDVGRKARPMQVTPNITVFDEDEGEPTVLPGRSTPDIGRKAIPMAEALEERPKPRPNRSRKAPSNIKIIDDPEGERGFTKINRLLNALVLPGGY